MNQKHLNINNLFDAIEEDQDVDKVRELIEAGYYHVDSTVEEGCTPLIAAVLIGIALRARQQATGNRQQATVDCKRFSGFRNVLTLMRTAIIWKLSNS